MKTKKMMCPAKINLFLSVGKLRPDNYHEIDTVFQKINLYDELTIEKADKFSLELLNNTEIKGVNLCEKAYLMLEPKLDSSVKIKLKKNIPIGAGLGGGSSDAAGTLILLNDIFDLRLPKAELFEMARKLGADVPFFLTEGTQIGKGIGDILQPAYNYKDRLIYLVNPKIHISSANIYAKIKTESIKTSEEFINELKKGESLKSFNSMEEVVFKEYPEILKIKEKLIEKGALLSLMSGSGSSVFGVFKTPEAFLELDEYFLNKNYDVYRLKTL